ncbi:MAG: SAM-dependent methyltransferase, partial [Acidipropionibacterium jensenii]|nr:SAM-dependent methyltransferase [Acidipropionibacterium jensenii]
ACLWFFARDKGVGPGGSVDRRGQVLFIDAREMGYMITRAQRGLRAEEIQRIADTVHAWRGMEQLAVSTADVTVEEDAEVTAAGAEYDDVAGFCKSVSTADIKAAGYALTPGRYVGMAEAPEDAEPLDEKIARLTSELNAQFAESSLLQNRVHRALENLA